MLLAVKIIVPAEYSDFVNVFLEKSANVLSEQTGVNEQSIKLEKSKQPPYRLIYNLKPVELGILKTYIKTNLANNFIRASKLPVNPLILFVYKPNSSLYLCINY